MQARSAPRSAAGGGGDYPEAMDQAHGPRGRRSDWRPDAVRSLLLVADAPPHDENVAKTWPAAEAARAPRIQIVPVAASGVGDTAEYVMRAMAAATQSRYLFLTDDSGIGNPHAAAGDRLLSRHPARHAGPARARQPDFRPPRSSRDEGEVIRSRRRL